VIVHPAQRCFFPPGPPFIIAFAAFITCGAAIANADSDFEPRSVTVHYADVDAANSQGAAVLYRRLRNASASVCRAIRASGLPPTSEGAQAAALLQSHRSRRSFGA
jgi:UrcA family protein